MLLRDIESGMAVESWVAAWLQSNPTWRLADHDEIGSRWLAEDGWLDRLPARRDPPFSRHLGQNAWALVIDSGINGQTLPST